MLSKQFRWTRRMRYKMEISYPFFTEVNSLTFYWTQAICLCKNIQAPRMKTRVLILKWVQIFLQSAAFWMTVKMISLVKNKGIWLAGQYNSLKKWKRSALCFTQRKSFQEVSHKLNSFKDKGGWKLLRLIRQCDKWKMWKMRSLKLSKNFSTTGLGWQDSFNI